LYNGICSAIPSEWKKLIRNYVNATNYHVYADYNVTIEDVEKTLIEITSKVVYWHLVKQIEQRATSETKWEDESGINFDENDWEYT
jgi:hypothetical protein